MKYSNEELMTMYRTMVEGRMFDLELDRQNNQGKLSGMFHFSINQEAIGTAVAHALADDERLCRLTAAVRCIYTVWINVVFWKNRLD